MSKLNPNNVISCRKTDKGTYEYHVLGVGTWDHFDSLAEFFVEKYGASVQSSEDVIYIRKWQFKIDDEIFTLYHHEDIGNCFFSSNGDGRSPLMEKISKDIDNRLRDVDYE
ncbi:hypothetical protein NSQ26_07655 [Bacillus sp. FSL W7-1360]